MSICDLTMATGGAAMWDSEGHRTFETIARPAAQIAEVAGFSIPDDKTFIIVKEDKIGKQHLFSSENISLKH